MITTFNGDLNDINIFTLHDTQDPIEMANPGDYSIVDTEIGKYACHCKRFSPGSAYSYVLKRTAIGSKIVWIFELDCYRCGDIIYKYYSALIGQGY